MWGFKTLFILYLFAIAAASCKAPAGIFTYDEHINAAFFKNIPGVSERWDCAIDSVTAIEVYRAVLTEKLVEKNDVLELSMLNNASKAPFADYKQVRGYMQQLYLFRMVTKEGLTNACIYLPVKYGPGKRECIGFGPAYFGCIDTIKKKIQFFSELKVQKKGNQFHFTGKKSVSMLFFADHLPGPGVTDIEIAKIIFEDYNKFGGSKPVVFNIKEVFHDPAALHFTYRGPTQLKTP